MFNPVNFNTLTAGFYKIEGDVIIGDADWYDVNNYFVVGPLNYENNKRIKRILNLTELTMYFVERTGTSPNYTYTLHNYNGYLVTQYDLTQIYDSIDDIASDVDNRLVDMEEELADMEVQIPTTLWEGTSTRPINLDTINAGFYELKGNVTIGGGIESFDFGTSGGAFSVGEWVDNKRKVTYLNRNWTYTIERTGTSPNYTYSLVYSDSDKTKGVPIVGNDLGSYYTKTETNTLLNGKANTSDIPTKVSDLQNDSNFTTKSYVDGLVGDIGTILDNINGESL